MEKQNFYYLVSFLLAIAIVGMAFFIFSSYSAQFAYSFESENVLFVSNTVHPGEFLSSVGSKDYFMVSPAFYESGSTSFMTESLTLFNSVLIVKGKSVKTLARVVDPQKNLLYCQSNDGNVLENFQVDTALCMQELGSFQGIVFEIELPDPSLSKSMVEISGNRVILSPKDYSEVPRVSFVVISTIFPDASEIIGSVNEVLSRVGV